MATCLKQCTLKGLWQHSNGEGGGTCAHVIRQCHMQTNRQCFESPHSRGCWGHGLACMSGQSQAHPHGHREWLVSTNAPYLCLPYSKAMATCRTRSGPDEGTSRLGMPHTPSTSQLGLALDGQPRDGPGCSGRLDPGGSGGDGLTQRLAVLKQRGGGLAGAADLHVCALLFYWAMLVIAMQIPGSLSR